MRERASARATEPELVVVAAVLEVGSEKAAAHRLRLSHSTVKHHLASARSRVGATTTAQLVWILSPAVGLEPAAPFSQAQLDAAEKNPAAAVKAAADRAAAAFGA